MTFADFGIVLPPGRVSGEVYTTCPKCSHNRRKKNARCLGVNIDQGIWHCNHCNWSGSLRKKQYRLPVWENRTQLSDKVVTWFQQRNISQDTLLRMKVTESREFMPQANEERNVICFNYFRDGKLINVKYRDGAKNFKMYKDAELIFYNLDGIKDRDEVIIVEGEIDCLTLVQLGYENTVSVPNGASKGTNNLQYLDNCYSYFENVKKVIIATDTDEPGEQLAKELARRIGVEKCWRARFGVYKDANEMYCKEGAVRFTDMKPFPIEGIYTVADHWEGVLHILKHGYPKGWKPRGRVGELITIHPGYMTIITGIPGHGKSEYLDQLLLQLMIDYDLRCAYFSPENYPTEVHLIKLVEKIIGVSAWKANQVSLEAARKFLDDRVFWVYPEEDYGLDTILKKMRQAVLRHGVQLFVIDPWNKLEHQYEGSETKYVSEALDRIQNFNKKNGTHSFIVAHPTKMKFNHETGRYEVPGLYDISGSANYYNKTDIGMCMYKNEEKSNTLYVQKVKFKYWGKNGQVDFYWNPENGRYEEGMPDTRNWLGSNTQERLFFGSDDEPPF